MPLHYGIPVVGAGLLLVLVLVACMARRCASQQSQGPKKPRAKGKTAHGPAKSNKHRKSKKRGNEPEIELDSWNVDRQLISMSTEDGFRGRKGFYSSGIAQNLPQAPGKHFVFVKSCDDQRLIDEFLADIEAIKPLSDPGHDNILGLVATSLNSMPYLMVLENCPNGNVSEYLSSYYRNDNACTASDLTELLPLAVDIATGLAWLEEQFIVHKTLRAECCLVNADLTVKIG